MPPWTPRGARERYGVKPAPLLLRQGPLRRHPGRGLRRRAAVMDIIDHGAAQMGTFNGNPLVAAAGLACLTEVLTPDAYERLAALGRPAGRRMPGGDRRAPASLPTPSTSAAKGCVSFRKERSRNYRDFLDTKPQLFGAAVPVGAQPGPVHDARRRGAVDALGAAHRGRHRPLRRAVHGLLQRVGRGLTRAPTATVVRARRCDRCWAVVSLVSVIGCWFVVPRVGCLLQAAGCRRWGAGPWWSVAFWASSSRPAGVLMTLTSVSGSSLALAARAWCCSNSSGGRSVMSYRRIIHGWLPWMSPWCLGHSRAPSSVLVCPPSIQSIR